MGVMASRGPLLPTGAHVKALSHGEWEVGRILYEDPDKSHVVGTRVFEARRSRSPARDDGGEESHEAEEAFPVALKVGWSSVIDLEARTMLFLERYGVRHKALVRHASGMWHKTDEGRVGFLAVERFEATLVNVVLLPSAPAASPAATAAGTDAPEGDVDGGARGADAAVRAGPASPASAASAGPARPASGARWAPRPPVYMSMRQLIVATRSLVGALQALHVEAGMLHRDVAPVNIGIRNRSDPTDVALFDLDSNFFAGLPKVQLSGRERPLYIRQALGSTRLRYASIGTHGNGTVHPCDDLEQLGYVMLEVALGGLPWAAAAQGLDQEEEDLDGEAAQGVRKAKLACVQEIKANDDLKWLHDYLTTVHAEPLKRTSMDAPYKALLDGLDRAIAARGGAT